jgi:type I site-specific restriction-modification system R (restriction) subunit
MFPQLSFPQYPLRVNTNEGKKLVFDVVRKKWVALTPEEWVRQHVLWFLINEKAVPESLISVEKSLTINTLTKRFDILVYDKNTCPVMLIECKAPGVKLSQSTLEQAARYNLRYKVGLLFITNGLQHYCIAVNHETQQFRNLSSIPEYPFSYTVDDQ